MTLFYFLSAQWPAKKDQHLLIFLKRILMTEMINRWALLAVLPLAQRF